MRSVEQNSGLNIGENSIPKGLLMDMEVKNEVDGIINGGIPSIKETDVKHEMAPRHTRNCPLTAAFCKPSSSFGCIN